MSESEQYKSLHEACHEQPLRVDPDSILPYAVLLGTCGQSHKEIARRMGVSRPSVWRWQRRPDD